jgi:hypothetical protein
LFSNKTMIMVEYYIFSVFGYNFLCKGSFYTFLRYIIISDVYLDLTEFILTKSSML